MAAVQADVGVRLIAGEADLKGRAVQQVRDLTSTVWLRDVLAAHVVRFDLVVAAA